MRGAPAAVVCLGPGPQLSVGQTELDERRLDTEAREKLGSDLSGRFGAHEVEARAAFCPLARVGPPQRSPLVEHERQLADRVEASNERTAAFPVETDAHGQLDGREPERLPMLGEAVAALAVSDDIGAGEHVDEAAAGELTPRLAVAVLGRRPGDLRPDSARADAKRRPVRAAPAHAGPGAAHAPPGEPDLPAAGPAPAALDDVLGDEAEESQQVSADDEARSAVGDGGEGTGPRLEELREDDDMPGLRAAGRNEWVLGRPRLDPGSASRVALDEVIGHHDPAAQHDRADALHGHEQAELVAMPASVGCGEHDQRRPVAEAGGVADVFPRCPIVVGARPAAQVHDSECRAARPRTPQVSGLLATPAMRFASRPVALGSGHGTSTRARLAGIARPMAESDQPGTAWRPSACS